VRGRTAAASAGEEEERARQGGNRCGAPASAAAVAAPAAAGGRRLPRYVLGLSRWDGRKRRRGRRLVGGFGVWGLGFGVWGLLGWFRGILTICIALELVDVGRLQRRPRCAGGG